MGAKILKSLPNESTNEKTNHENTSASQDIHLKDSDNQLTKQQQTALSQLPKLGSLSAHKKGEKSGLTPIQVDYKIKELTGCIVKGKSPSECKSCKKKRAYMYNSFAKRGGTKRLYCCGNCLYSWSEFDCEEEDYDFLPG